MSDENDNAQAKADPSDKFEAYTEEGVKTLSGGDDTETIDPKKPEAKADGKEGEKDKSSEADADKNGGEEIEAKDSGGRRSTRRFEKRIAKLTKRSKENGERAEKAEQRAQAAEAKLAKIEAQESRPKRDDFDSAEKYDEKLESWSREQAKAGESDKDEQNSEEPEGDFEDALDDVFTSFDENKSRFKDFDKLVTSSDLVITNEMVMQLSEMDDPTAVAYYLGNNKDEAKTIAGLTPTKQARAFGKIEAMLEVESKAATDDGGDPEKNKAKDSGGNKLKAPAPINPLKGSDSGEVDLENASFSEYERQRRTQSKGKGKFW